MKSYNGVITVDGEESAVTWRPDGEGFAVTVGDRLVGAQGRILTSGTYSVTTGGEAVHVAITRDGHFRYVTANGVTWQVILRRGAKSVRQRGATIEQTMTSPMPGVVIGVDVVVGDSVKKGTVLMRIEAMKMEHAIVAPRDGVVLAIHFGVGDQVQAGAHLAELTN